MTHALYTDQKRQKSTFQGTTHPYNRNAVLYHYDIPFTISKHMAMASREIWNVHLGQLPLTRAMCSVFYKYCFKYTLCDMIFKNICRYDTLLRFHWDLKSWNHLISSNMNQSIVILSELWWVSIWLVTRCGIFFSYSTCSPFRVSACTVCLSCPKDILEFTFLLCWLSKPLLITAPACCGQHFYLKWLISFLWCETMQSDWLEAFFREF